MSQRLSFVAKTLTILLFTCFLLVPSLAAEKQPQRGGKLRYGTVTEVSSLDPHIYVGTSWKVINLCIYQSLLGFNQKGDLVPALAVSWETPDAKTYIFKLRKGVKFHKGQPFSARDVKFSLERILDPVTGATIRSNLVGIKITIEDDYAIKLEKDKPDATMLGVLAMPEASIISEEWMKTKPNIKVEANGTGPFYLAEHEPRVRAVVRSNPHYYEKGLPYLDEVEFNMISNSDARVNALRTGAVDMIEFVPWKDIDILAKEKEIEIQTAGGAFMNLWFNTSKKPFNDPKVRRAVAYAIDRDAISTAAFFGHGTPLFGPPTSPEAWYYSKDLSETFSYDPKQAKALLNEAGYPNGFDVELAVYQGLRIYTQTAQIIQANLKDVGINAKIQLLEWATLVERKNKAQYDFLIWGVNIKLPDPDVYSYYFGSESSYWAKPVRFSDYKIEGLLKEGRALTDKEKRKELYYKLEKRILELCPWVFINWRDQAQAYKKNIKGHVQMGGAFSESGPGISMKTIWISK